MKKMKSIISVLCSLCLLAGIFSFTAVNASANYSETPQIKTVRIRCMWNSNYIYNDAGQAKYAPNASMPASDLKSVWNIEQNSDGLYTIRNADGSYLYASDDTAKCSFAFNRKGENYYWDIKDAGDGKVRIISAADTSKAINIENLTGSLQLTTYYDTWESARWIIEDTTALNPTVENNDRVILQYGGWYDVTNHKIMYGGLNVGGLNIAASSLSEGKFFYRIIENNQYCYIEYAPINGNHSYFYAEDSDTVALSDTLVAGDMRYRWVIEQGVDGMVSLVSYLYPEKCIVLNNGSCALGEITYGNWSIRSGNSMTVNISDGYKLCCAYPFSSNNENNAYFRVGSPSADPSVNWQVIYKGSQFYLKNVHDGKYLMTKGTSDDSQLYVAYYSAANDSQYLWSNDIVDGKGIFVGKNSAIIYRGNEAAAPRADRDAYASPDSYNENIYFDYEANFWQLN